MGDHQEADRFITALTNKVLLNLATELNTIFLKSGCRSYVKTIYIGYEIDGEMVGAMYPRVDSIEIALALSEEHDDPDLVDAGHLTWRTLPLLVEIRTMSQITKAKSLIYEAVDRVSSSRHNVNRTNDYFIQRKSRRN